MQQRRMFLRKRFSSIQHNTKITTILLNFLLGWCFLAKENGILSPVQSFVINPPTLFQNRNYNQQQYGLSSQLDPSISKRKRSMTQLNLLNSSNNDNNVQLKPDQVRIGNHLECKTNSKSFEALRL